MRVEIELDRPYLTKLKKENFTDDEWVQTLKNLNLNKDVVEITVEFRTIFSVEK